MDQSYKFLYKYNNSSVQVQDLKKSRPSSRTIKIKTTEFKIKLQALEFNKKVKIKIQFKSRSKSSPRSSLRTIKINTTRFKIKIKSMFKKKSMIKFKNNQDQDHQIQNQDRRP